MRLNLAINTGLAITIMLYSFCSARIVPQFMPDSIKQINSVAELEPYLSSPNNSSEQHWGVERLGQIGTADDIPRLLDIYQNAPFELHYAIDRGADIKDKALLAIGDIGGQEALSALFSIFDKLDVHKIKCVDSMEVVSYTCLALGKIGSPEATDRLNSIYADTSISWPVREDAKIGLISIELAKPEYAAAGDTVNYLLNELSNNFSPNMVDMENYIITDAIYMVLYRTSNQALLNEIDRQSAQYEGNHELKEYLDKIKLMMDGAIKENR